MNKNLSTENLDFGNYLINLSEYNLVGDTNVRLNNMGGFLKSIFKDIKNVKGHGSVKFVLKKLSIPSRTMAQWKAGSSPITITNLFRILKVWQSVCEKSELDFKNIVNEVFSNVEFFSVAKGKKVKLPKFMTKDLAYVLGYLLGDGYLKDYVKEMVRRKDGPRYVIRFAVSEKAFATEILEPKFREIFNICGHLYKTNRNCFEYNIQSKVIYIFLNKICEIPVGKKKGKMKIPNIILKSSEEIKKTFIAGFFDGDGCIYVKNKDVSISQADKRFLENLAVFINGLGITTRKIYTQLKKEGITYCLSLSWSSIKKFIDEIPLLDQNRIKKRDELVAFMSKK